MKKLNRSISYIVSISIFISSVFSNFAYSAGGVNSIYFGNRQVTSSNLNSDIQYYIIGYNSKKMNSSYSHLNGQSISNFVKSAPLDMQVAFSDFGNNHHGNNKNSSNGNIKNVDPAYLQLIEDMLRNGQKPRERLVDMFRNSTYEGIKTYPSQSIFMAGVFGFNSILQLQYQYGLNPNSLVQWWNNEMNPIQRFSLLIFFIAAGISGNIIMKIAGNMKMSLATAELIRAPLTLAIGSLSSRLTSEILNNLINDPKLKACGAVQKAEFANKISGDGHAMDQATIQACRDAEDAYAYNSMLERFGPEITATFFTALLNIPAAIAFRSMWSYAKAGIVGQIKNINKMRMVINDFTVLWGGASATSDLKMLGIMARGSILNSSAAVGKVAGKAANSAIKVGEFLVDKTKWLHGFTLAGFGSLELFLISMAVVMEPIVSFYNNQVSKPEEIEDITLNIRHELDELHSNNWKEVDDYVCSQENKNLSATLCRPELSEKISSLHEKLRNLRLSLMQEPTQAFGLWIEKVHDSYLLNEATSQFYLNLLQNIKKIADTNILKTSVKNFDPKKLKPHPFEYNNYFNGVYPEGVNISEIHKISGFTNNNTKYYEAQSLHINTSIESMLSDLTQFGYNQILDSRKPKGAKGNLVERITEDLKVGSIGLAKMVTEKIEKAVKQFSNSKLFESKPKKENQDSKNSNLCTGEPIDTYQDQIKNLSEIIGLLYITTEDKNTITENKSWNTDQKQAFIDKLYSRQRDGLNKLTCIIKSYESRFYSKMMIGSESLAGSIDQWFTGAQINTSTSNDYLPLELFESLNFYRLLKRLAIKIGSPFESHSGYDSYLGTYEVFERFGSRYKSINHPNNLNGIDTPRTVDYILTSAVCGPKSSQLIEQTWCFEGLSGEKTCGGNDNYLPPRIISRDLSICKYNATGSQILESLHNEILKDEKKSTNHEITSDQKIIPNFNLIANNLPQKEDLICENDEELKEEDTIRLNKEKSNKILTYNGFSDWWNKIEEIQLISLWNKYTKDYSMVLKEFNELYHDKNFLVNGSIKDRLVEEIPEKVKLYLNQINSNYHNQGSDKDNYFDIDNSNNRFNNGISYGKSLIEEAKIYIYLINFILQRINNYYQELSDTSNISNNYSRASIYGLPQFKSFNKLWNSDIMQEGLTDQINSKTFKYLAEVLKSFIDIEYKVSQQISSFSRGDSVSSNIKTLCNFKLNAKNLEKEFEEIREKLNSIDTIYNYKSINYVKGQALTPVQNELKVVGELVHYLNEIIGGFEVFSAYVQPLDIKRLRSAEDKEF